MMDASTWASAAESAAASKLRTEVRDFLAVELADSPAHRRAASWSGFDSEFSRKVGMRGWIGMTWPKKYGGQERTTAERYVMLEEMLATGAPVAAHWIADRQSGPLLLKFGTEQQKQSILPRIVAGECFSCIGMSEPGSGSDLAAVRTRAIPEAGGFRINGTKLWTTNAHHAHYMLLFCRTSEAVGDRHSGTSQLLVDLTTPGIKISPIMNLAGEADFNEVVFEDVLVPSNALVGIMGNGWEQVTSELAYERSGPERFLSSFVLLTELVRVLQRNPTPHAEGAIGRLIAHLVVLRHMSRSVAWLLQQGTNPSLPAAMVKDLGALFEQEIPDIARSLITADPSAPGTAEFCRVLSYTILAAPAFSLRGGTREILRGIIGRGLGLR
jgi:alkylation response protein AidB-like acyl-CoA dehydrogenase